LRLFTCGCCRRAWHLCEERERQLLEVAERAADGRATRRELKQAEAEAAAIVRERQDEAVRSPDRRAHLRYTLAMTLQSVTTGYLSILAGSPALCVPATLRAWEELNGRPVNQEPTEAEERWPAELLRDLFYNPFRPPPTLPDGLPGPKQGTVAKLARAIYDEHRFADLAVLADALEEAGCTDAEVLAHCRSGGEHARGCWLVDLLLGEG
jgi:hypothetical protein